MSFEYSLVFRSIGKDNFYAVDKTVMRHAFDIHNALGSFCDERIYQEELAQRCRVDGLEVDREVQVRAIHKGFTKPYYLDMLVERSIIYELKAVKKLNTSHEKQLINYLLLTGLRNGKLLNFRSGSVEYRFVSTSLDPQARASFRFVDSDWDHDGGSSRKLRQVLLDLLNDWGAFLDVSLYQEALLHLLDQPGMGMVPVDILVSGRKVGVHRMCLLNQGSAWHISAIRQRMGFYETHLNRLLQHTPLDKIHWINLNQRTITLKTIRNNPAANDPVAP